MSKMKYKRIIHVMYIIMHARNAIIYNINMLLIP